uniref:Sodium-coupled monocarboxylate transporter 1-like n=1 Tax=Neolamprologus brichardi TaxID=32507 RepID=A0A3Q4I0Z1_NEOBR
MCEDLAGADSLHIADYAVFVLMLLVSASIGLYWARIGRRQPNTREFLTGGRKLTALPVSLSLTASVLSSIILISIPVEVMWRDWPQIQILSFVVSYSLFLGSAVFSGLCLYSFYKDCDPWTAGKVSFSDQLLPYLVMDILKGYPGLPGLFLAAVYSGTLSTVSSIINTLAAVTLEDLIKPNVTLTDRQLLHISRALSTYLIWLCVSMAGLASLMGLLAQARIIISGVSGSPMFGLFVLGILCPFANSTGGLFGLAFGFAASLFVSLGSMLSYADPEMTRPLSLSTEGCNFTIPGSLNWTTDLPTQMNSFTMAQVQDGATHLLTRNWHSPSYRYFSVIGFITTVIVGAIVSLYTGGLKQKVAPSLMLMKEDMLSYHLFKLIKCKVSAVA